MHGDRTNLPEYLHTGRYDVALSIEVFELVNKAHLNDFLKQVDTVLKHGGFFRFVNHNLFSLQGLFRSFKITVLREI